MLAALEGGRVDHGDRNEGASLPAPQALPLELPEATHRAIARATAAHVDTVARHDLRCEDYTTYGKNAVKAIGVSPDAWCQVRKKIWGRGRRRSAPADHQPASALQLALQLAYYRLHGRFTGTYEAAQTRQCVCGQGEGEEEERGA